MEYIAIDRYNTPINFTYLGRFSGTVALGTFWHLQDKIQFVG